jgi:tetratricopeptide (TPR) repeat protein
LAVGPFCFTENTNPSIMAEQSTEKQDNTEPSFKLNYISAILLLALLIPAVYTIVVNLQAPPPPPEITKEQPQQAQAKSATDPSVIEAALKRVAEKPNFDSYINLGLVYYGALKYDDAIKAWNKAIELNPNSALAYNDVAAAYGAINNYDEEIKACEKALSIDPNMALAKNNLNWARSQKNKK